MRTFLAGLATLLVLAGCASTAPSTPLATPLAKDQAARPKAPRAVKLTAEEAALRARQVAHPTYSLWIGLDALNENYEGRVVINFELRAKARDLSKTLFVDFNDGTLRSVTVNGTPVPEPRYDGDRIFFKTQDLPAGANRIEIGFIHPYSKDGQGLHRFRDPVDNEVYLYTHFEPFAAHRMFPCFDQPDLKASYELTVEAPHEWHVISNTLEREVSKVDGRRSWAFPPSPVLSTYLVALHAGPFASWKSNANGIPLRLFSRKSVAKWVDSPEWFDVTSRGLEYFTVQFGYPYPYSKYDQVLVPDFKGAMENAGAVTFSENFIYRSPVTQDRRRRRANVILHEMAHMWFGDLVTMKWWNGLWLNEGFASLLASRAVDEATTFKGEWQSFFGGTKQWAYWEDQSVVTHPIEVPMPDTDSARANFDGITYGKGAAVLRQLAHFLGEDDFREGVQRYFLKYALRNTTLPDFMKMLAEASGRDLTAWQNAWFLTSGVNTLEAKWACSAGKVTDFSLLQGPDDENGGILRPHRARVALYRLGKAGRLELKPTEIVDVSYAQAETPVPALLGHPCPDFVYPNHEDFDYAKVSLDPKSLETMRQGLSRLGDSFAREMVWGTLWQMVIDARLRAQDYAELVLKHGLKENDTQILGRLLRSLVQNSPEDSSVVKFLPLSERTEFLRKLESLFFKKLGEAPPGSDRQLVWYNAFLKIARTGSSLDFLSRLLSGKTKLRGFSIDQERRWGLVQSLARAGFEGTQALIQAEHEKDKTDMGDRAAIEAEALIPTPENKRVWLAKILSSLEPALPARALSVSKFREVVWVFHDLDHEDLSRLAVEPFFSSLHKLAEPANLELARAFVHGMYPALCDPLLSKRAAEALAAHPDLPASVVKSLKVHQQEDARCMKARARAAGQVR